MSNKTVKVTLAAEVGQFVAGMGQATKATEQLSKSGEGVKKWSGEHAAAATLVGSSMLVAGASIVAGLGLSAKAAMDWESAWTGVLKTVDGTPAQLAMVEDGLRGLARELPASHAEIAAVAEAAGQLGIQTEHVVDFTRTMIDLGETTNLSAEQAAMSLARFMNVMNTSQSQVSNLGSALVGLGNNFATTEADILAMAQRLAGAGYQVGLTEGEVLGLATSLSSVGIEAEAGGSAMSKVMIDIAASVDKGGERVEQFARVAGMSASEFASKWRSEPGAALTAFVQGLADAEAQGTSTLGILAELGITEVRMRDALLGAAAAAGTFSDAMAMGNEEFAKNTALQQEAELRYGTTASKLGILGNRFTEVGINLGRALIPAVEDFTDRIGGLADFVAGALNGPLGGLVAWGGSLAGGMLLAGGALLTIMPRIVETQAALATLGITMDGIRARAATMFAPLLTPMGIAGTVAAVSAGVIVWHLFAKAMEDAERQADAVAAQVSRLQSGVTDFSRLAEISSHRRIIPRGEDQQIARTADELGRLKELLGALGREDANLFDFDARNTIHGMKDARVAIQQYGDALAELAGTNMPAVANKLRDLRQEYGLSRDDIWQLVNESSSFQEALRGQALAAGVAVGDLSSYAEQMRLVEWLLNDAEIAAEGFGDGLSSTERAAQEAQQAIDDLVDSLRALDDAMSSHLNAELGFHEALQDVGAALEKNGATLDMNTEAGRANWKALDDLAQSTNDYAAEVLAMTGSQAAASLVLEDGRKAFIENGIAMGMTEERANMLADAYFGLPGEVLTEVHDGGTIDATNRSTQDLHAELGALPPNTNVKVTGLTAEAMDRLRALGYTVTTLPDGTVHVTTSGAGAVESTLNSLARDRYSTIHVNTVLNTAAGTQYRQQIRRDGGLDVHEFANGGFPTGIYKAHPNSIYKFAEPETRWEAFISGRPGQEERNIGIALEALRRLGWQERAFADGGIAATVAAARSQPSYSTSRTTIHNGIMPGTTLVLEVDGREIAGVIRAHAGPVAQQAASAAVREYDRGAGVVAGHGRQKGR